MVSLLFTLGRPQTLLHGLFHDYLPLLSFNFQLLICVFRKVGRGRSTERVAKFNILAPNRRLRHLLPRCACQG